MRLSGHPGAEPADHRGHVGRSGPPGNVVANDTIAYRFVVLNNSGGAVHGLQVNGVRIGHGIPVAG
jgi:hypothetical protein